jgi:PAS domain S-box-containing protein
MKLKENFSDKLDPKERERLSGLESYFESKDDLKELILNFDTNVIVSETDLNGKITFVSSAFCEMSGYSKDELIGKPHNLIRHKDMPKSAFQSLWETIKNGKVWNGEVKNKRKDGSFYWVKAIVSPKIRDGKPVGYTSIRQDITSQKEIERLSKENVDKQIFLDILINSLDQIIVVTDGTHIKKVNKKFLEFYEVPNIEQFHKLGYSCICDTFEKRDGFIQKIMPDGEDWVSFVLSNRDKDNYVLIKKDSFEYIYQVSVMSLFIENQFHNVAVFLDVTEQRKRELELIDYKQIISDSIDYASYIQNAVLPEVSILNNFTKDSFVIWEPRDRVGGDVYFVNKLSENELLLMVVDCTSHGVPGAFVSMLVKAIQNQLLTDIRFGRINPSLPSKVLEYFNKHMKEILNQYDVAHSSSNVGFDGGVLYYNKFNGIIVYSGAGTPLYYVEDGEVKMTKYDKESIGYVSSDENFKYRNYFFNDLETKQFYITTDGFYDQVGDKKRMMFGKKRVGKLINELKDQPMIIQKEMILERLADFQGTESRRDDVTFIGLQL